ncbi:E3 ubiquitin-protein ligase rnf213-alpha-like [Gigantopelta aegis]|uniref:E3 ubiquitin-protein ligase rnf213-alpha-like n=1 Tax=Gigantopelta aegis TaxID=1735272 RepID=UPI001B88E071|nr:E3 ubiquitin-protein ligase rnf213-alpha-like [Gigantopelta aegis]
METTMIKCVSCQTEISSLSKFCLNCGTRVNLTPNVKHSVKCPGLNGPCGNTLTVDAKFCSECGLKVDPSLFECLDSLHNTDGKAHCESDSKDYGEGHDARAKAVTETASDAEDQSECDTLNSQSESLASGPEVETQGTISQVSQLKKKKKKKKRKKKSKANNLPSSERKEENVAKQIIGDVIKRHNIPPEVSVTGNTSDTVYHSSNDSRNAKAGTQLDSSYPSNTSESSLVESAESKTPELKPDDVEKYPPVFGTGKTSDPVTVDGSSSVFQKNNTNSHNSQSHEPSTGTTREDDLSKNEKKNKEMQPQKHEATQHEPSTGTTREDDLSKTEKKNNELQPPKHEATRHEPSTGTTREDDLSKNEKKNNELQPQKHEATQREPSTGTTREDGQSTNEKKNKELQTQKHETTQHEPSTGTSREDDLSKNEKKNKELQPQKHEATQHEPSTGTTREDGQSTNEKKNKELQPQKHEATQHEPSTGTTREDGQSTNEKKNKELQTQKHETTQHEPSTGTSREDDLSKNEKKNKEMQPQKHEATQHEPSTGTTREDDLSKTEKKNNELQPPKHEATRHEPSTGTTREDDLSKNEKKNNELQPQKHEATQREPSTGTTREDGQSTNEKKNKELQTQKHETTQHEPSTGTSREDDLSKNEKKNKEPQPEKHEATKHEPSTGTSREDDLSKNEKKNKELQPQKHEGKKDTRNNQSVQNDQRTQRITRSHADKVDVVFHVIIADSKKFDPVEEDIYITFGTEVLYKWDSRRWKMNRTGTSGSCHEYSLAVRMPKDTRNGGFPYKYVFVRKSGVEHECVHFMIAKTKYDDPNRHFHLPHKRKSSEEWHQYDGFVYHPKPSSTWIESLKNFFKNTGEKVKNDTRKAAEHFLPSPKEIVQSLKNGNGSEPAEDLLQRISNIMGCLRIQMIDLDSTFIDEFFFSDCFDIVLEPLFNEISGSLQKEKTNGTADHTLSVAVFIMCLVKDNELKMQKRDKVMGTFMQSFLLQVDLEQRNFPNYELMKQNFPTRKEFIVRTLQEMINQQGKNAPDPSWLYCLPLLHFLRGDSEPFEMSASCEHRTEKWWGLIGLKDAERNIKRLSEGLTYYDYSKPYYDRTTSISPMEWTIPVQHVIEDLHLLFEADCLLPRSIMAVISMKHLEYAILPGWIPPDIVAACLFYYCHTFKAKDMPSDSKQLLAKLLEVNAEQFQRTANEIPTISERKMKMITEQLFLSKTIVKDLIDDNITSYSPQDLVPPLVSVCMAVVNGLAHVHQRMCQNQKEDLQISPKKEAHYLLEYLEKALLPWLSHQHDFNWRSKQNLENALMLGTTRSSEVLTIGMESRISDGLKERLTSVAFLSFEKEMMAVYITDGEKYGLLTDNCLDLLCKASDFLSLTVKNVLKGTIEVGSLKKVLLQKENILRLVVASEANYTDASATKTDVDYLRNVLEARGRELTACEEYLHQTDCLMSFCAHLNKVDTTDISRRTSKIGSTFDKLILENVCFAWNFQSQDRFEFASYQPSVNIFHIPDQLLFIIPQLKMLMQSGLFLAIWEREGNSDALNDGLNSVLVAWKSAKQKWDTLSMDIKKGTISFRNIQKHLYMFSSNYDQIKHEFTLMNDEKSSEWVDERIQQLKTFSLVDKCQKAAIEIMQIQKQFGFSGDFKPIEEILNLTKSANVAMKEMDQSVLETCKLLENVSDKQIESLVAFRQSKLLVDWLRQSMKAGLKELKVFVDLAYISAGEGDHEIQKVNCLHAATTGYAPLVFDCDQQCDYSMFLQSCQSVWRELKSNPNLPEMLRDTCCFLQWLKEVSQSHGSVEVTSLSQAGMINSKGLYRIGNLTRETAPPHLDLNHVISLHVMPDCAESDVVRKYSYNQLVDLQSRLMLVAGRAEKGKENVDLFMMILDGIVRLSRTYIKLISDGCVLFNCWKANFLCDVSRDACIILDFGETSESLKGHRLNHRLEEFINALANVFEDCHMDWLKYLSDKRDQYLELNFFTISQLVFLQKELIKIGTNVEPSDLVFPLLSLIKPECSMSDIQQAMQSAKDEIFQIEQMEELAREETEDAPMERQDTEQYFILELMKAGNTETLAQAAFNHVADADIDAAIVWCLEHEDDVEFQSSAVDPVGVTSEPSEEQFSGWNAEEISFASRAASLVRNLPELFKKDTSVTALTKNIEHIWKTFLGSVSSSVADYLSVEHLGIILRKLALSCDQSLNRKLPVQLKAKTPNLMVCQKSDMLNAVLHMYVEDPDQPLPRPDEVLLCTPETTFDEEEMLPQKSNMEQAIFEIDVFKGEALIPMSEDPLVWWKGHQWQSPIISQSARKRLCIPATSVPSERVFSTAEYIVTAQTAGDIVDIFLRRAFFSPLGKIHCLTYADLLRYEIEEKIEKKFIDYIVKANAKDCDYKLVVLCSSENEFRARLVAALDRHRCQPPIIRVKNIKDYLTEKFAAVRVEKNARSASHIDFSHSTVRVVKSKRAGIGKTLYKKRRVTELRELNPMFRDKDLSVSIPLYEKNVVMTQVVDKLLPCTLKPGQVFPRIFHLNISYEVQEGLDYLLFNLLILGKVSNEKGHIWLRSAMDLYLVEIIPISDVRDHRKTNARLIHPILEILPHVTCWSPQDSLQILTKTSRPDETTMKQCMSCLAELSATAKFCKKCGANVNITPKVLPRVKLKCPGKEEYCGNELDADDMFCEMCGWKVDQSLFENIDSHSITKDKETDLADCQGQGQDNEVKTETAKEDSQPPMLEAVSSTSDGPDAKFGEDDSEPDTLDSQPDSLMSDEFKEETAPGATTEGNKPKKKKKKKKKSSKLKCDKEAENVAEQTTNASADNRQSDESRVDQETKIDASVQESSSDMSKTVSNTNTHQQTVDKQLCNENNGQLTVCEQTSSQDVSISKSGMEKPASDADKEKTQTPKTGQAISSISESRIEKPASDADRENNQTTKMDWLSSSISKSQLEKLELDADKEKTQPPKTDQAVSSISESGIEKPESNAEKEKTQTPKTGQAISSISESRIEKPATDADRENNQTTKMDWLSSSISKSQLEKLESDADKEKTQPPKTDQAVSSISESGIEKPESNAEKEKTQTPKTDQAVSSQVTGGDKTTLEMLKQSDSAQNNTVENDIFYPPSSNDNNSSAAKMVFGTGKTTDHISVDGNDPQSREINTEKQKVQSAEKDESDENKQVISTSGSTDEDPQKSIENKEPGDRSSVDQQTEEKKEHEYPTYPKFEEQAKKKKKGKNKSATSKNVSQNDQSQDAKKDETESRASRPSFSDGVEVMFHVIISDNTNHDPAKEDIYIAFSSPVLHDWATDKWKMERSSKTGDYHEYNLSVKMSKAVRNKGFDYKYVFKKKNKVEYEIVHFMKVRKHIDNPDRLFFIPTNFKTSSDMWHQYDGFVYHPSPKEGWFEKIIKGLFKSMKAKLRSDTLKAAEHFLPHADEVIQCLKKEGGSVHAEDLMHKITAVMATLRIQIIDARGLFDPEFFSEVGI